MRTLLCQKSGNLLTDTAAGAADKRNFSGQIKQCRGHKAYSIGKNSGRTD
jgi:hypothetical protein